MKLVTFQSIDALTYLINNGYLECSEKYIDLNKRDITYSWITEKMNNRINNNTNAKYPIWCWVKCFNGICPPKHKGEPVEGFDVKITFNKNMNDVFITDFIRYSFVLNNRYIPTSLKDKNDFDKKLKKYNVTEDDLKAYVRKDKFKTHRMDKEYLQICEEIRNSFDRCITTNSDILQGCVWRINLSDIEKIEFLIDKSYRYGSLNYKRSNGSSANWIEKFYKNLK